MDTNEFCAREVLDVGQSMGVQPAATFINNYIYIFLFVQCHHMPLWTSWSSLLGMAGV